MKTKKTIQEAFAKALEMMIDSRFRLSDSIGLVVDENRSIDRQQETEHIEELSCANSKAIDLDRSTYLCVG